MHKVQQHSLCIAGTNACRLQRLRRTEREEQPEIFVELWRLYEITGGARVPRVRSDGDSGGNMQGRKGAAREGRKPRESGAAEHPKGSRSGGAGAEAAAAAAAGDDGHERKPWNTG